MKRDVLITVAVLATLICAPAIFLYVHHRHEFAPIEKHQRMLLYEISHEQLVADCHELWRRSEQGKIINVDPDALPDSSSICSLQAHSISIFPSGVNIEMGGQGCHYGFDVFFADSSNDSLRVSWKDEFPSKKISPQLWYYAENGVIAHGS